MPTYQCPECGEVDCICPCDICGRSGCRGDGIRPCVAEPKIKTVLLQVGQWVDAAVSKPAPNKKNQPRRVLVYSTDYARNGSCSPIQFGRWIEDLQEWKIDGSNSKYEVLFWAKPNNPA